MSESGNPSPAPGPQSPAQLPGRTIAGVVVADTDFVRAAVEFAKQHLSPPIFNHVMRSWLFASHIGQLQCLRFDGEVVAAATLLHDLGLTEAFMGPNRFEVDGANEARRFSSEHGVDVRRAQLIWDCVALHSTPSIGRHKEPEVALCNVGIGLDYMGTDIAAIDHRQMEQILDELPRLNVKEAFVEGFCHVLRVKPATSYDNFLRDFGERYLPEFRRPSGVDLMLNAPFEG